MRNKRKRDLKKIPWNNISDIIPSVLIGIEKVKRSRPKNIDSMWRSVVDSKYIKYTSVEKLVGGTLYIKVSSGSLYSELAMVNTDDVIFRIKRHGVYPSIKKVVYRR